MGLVVSSMVSRVKRPFRNFNLESRVHKILSQNKPVPAPKYETDQLEMERLLKENSSDFQCASEKNEKLDKNLKNIFVTSERVVLKDGKSQSERALPLDRRYHEEPVFGIVEPEKVSKGRVTLVNALKFITDHHAKPSQYSASHIAKEHNISEETVRNILRYCKTFEIYIPENRKTKAQFAGPSIPRMEVITRPSKQIESNKDEKGKT